MNIKTLIILIVLIGLGAGGFFIYKNIYRSGQPKSIDDQVKDVSSGNEDAFSSVVQENEAPNKEKDVPDKKESTPVVKEEPEEKVVQEQEIGSKEEETEPKKEGLIAYWNFDEGKGSVLGDSSGNSIEGGINGVAWVEGKKGTALEFDGSDDYVEINSRGISEVGKLQYGTISLWFKFTNWQETKILPLLYMGHDGQGIIDNLIIEIGHFNHGETNDKKIYYTLYNNASESMLYGDAYVPVLCFDSNQNLTENTWYHFAVVNGPSGNTGYLNGVELTNRDYNFSNSKDTRFFSSLSNKEIFRLGHGWFGIDKKFHHFSGTLDEIKIYNKALAREEIIELANKN